MPNSLIDSGKLCSYMNTLEERADLLLAITVRFVRRLSTVRSRHGLIDFEESMIMKKLREVERVERLAASFEFDPLLCSQRAKGCSCFSGGVMVQGTRYRCRCHEVRP